MNTTSARIGQQPHSDEAMEDVLFQANALIEELEPINLAQAQLSATIVSRVSLVTAFLLFCIAGYGYFLELKELAHPMVAFLSVGVMAFISAFLWKQTAINQQLAVALTLLILSLTVVSAWFNGVYPLYFLPVIVVFLHIIASPQLALISSLFVLVLTCIVFFSNSSEIELRAATRVIATGIISLVIFQVLARHNHRVRQAAEYVTSRLRSLASSLEADLRQARNERDIAKYTDANSGLLNIFGFHEKLSIRLHNKSHSHPLAIVNIKFPVSGMLMRSELFNESHNALDLIVGRLKSFFDPDLIGHLSHWEFVGVMEVGPSHEYFLESLAEQINAFSRSINLDESSQALQLFAGVAFWPDNGQLPRVLTSRANRAMLHAADIHFYKPLVYGEDIEELISRKKELIASMKGAFERNEFELYFQPIVLINPPGLHQAEALVRWNHTEQGLLFPGAFLALVESYGYMTQLTHYCLQSAVRTVRVWRQTIAPNFQISVNIPPTYLVWCRNHRQEAIDFFKSLEVEKHAIKLEITEDSLMDVDREIIEFLMELKELGFLLALDDFGTGYSSFSRLEALPLDAIKIDKSLIDDLEKSPQKLRVCSAIIHLGHEFGFQVVAEGVEHASQKSLLQEAGCDLIQGYLYSKPVNRANFESYCANFKA